MYKLQIVLELLVLYVGISHSWDIAVSYKDVLEFYTNETQIVKINFKSHHLSALAYDEVHDRLLYVDKQNNNDAICGYNISPNTYYCYLETHGKNIHGLAFDPVTELVIFSDTNERSINWIQLVAKADNFGHLLIKLDEGIPTDIAVDSCRGYVYWISTNLPTPKIERL
ncbi:hypothetical protein PYW07_010933 [Mythimna separata]|uniref:Uncharacterized protein n=1 Tax=Mythimna separata TaxID=271217 RepID=A0AAD8DKU7_MYTSE|nr:hypothetical protein PYW07_010933 [Mythimna separata]